MLLAVLLGLMLAPPNGEPVVIPIYIGFPVREDGFVDVDRATSDSIRDIRQALRAQLAKTGRGREVIFLDVQTEAEAVVKLYVLGRGHGPATSAGTLNIPGTTTVTPGTTTTTKIGGTTWENTTPATVTTTPGVSIEMQSKLTYVATTLRVGTFERPFVGEGQDAGWRNCAKKIAQDVAAWLIANRERIELEMLSTATNSRP